MKVLKDLGTRYFAGSKRRFALLQCEFCNKIIEGTIQRKKSKSCGCNTRLKANIDYNLATSLKYGLSKNTLNCYLGGIKCKLKY